MACACGSKKPESMVTYVHTAPSGEQKTYKTEVEAAAATARLGGTYRAQ